VKHPPIPIAYATVLLSSSESLLDFPADVIIKALLQSPGCPFYPLKLQPSVSVASLTNVPTNRRAARDHVSPNAVPTIFDFRYTHHSKKDE
jgi:hypothetical protein